jgi:uncharacterized protein (TIGR03663 family)
MAARVDEGRSFWDTPVTALVAVDWEKVVLVVLILLAIGSRFWELGARSYNHDESIHTSESYDLYTGKGYIHNPIFHGPLLYHLTAATFFLFGDTDVTGRVPNVVFGIVLVSLPFFFRKWLGRRGWAITSLLLLISPAVTYYSRFNRHDIYVEVFAVLLLLTVLKYYQARTEAANAASDDHSVRWLYAAATVLAFSFTMMETTFIFTALFAYFLTAAFMIDWLRHRRPDGNLTEQVAFAAILGIPFFAVYIGYLSIVQIAHYLNVDLKIDDMWRTSPSFSLSAVLGTLTMPLVIPPLFINYVLGRDPLDYSAGGIASSGTVLVAVVILSAVIGLMWDWRKWLICALLFYPITIFFFTTVFTNPGGLGTGFIGSLGYWLTQQGVHRGDQPPYYYLMVTLPMYEYLPYSFGLLGILFMLFKRGARRMAYFLAVMLPLLGFLFYVWFTGGILPLAQSILKSKDNLAAGDTTVLVLIVLVPLFLVLHYDPSDARNRFPTLLGIWTLGVLILFSWAGEKMPWLLVHLTIPLAFVSGYFMESVLNGNWRALYRRGALLFGLLLALGLLTLGMMLLIGPAPLNTGNQQIDQLSQTMSRILSLLIVAICAGVSFYLALRLELKDTLRIALVTVFVILALFTIHTTALAAYQNSDLAVETLIYAQGTPDVPHAMSEIEQLSRRLCGQAAPDSKIKINCDNNTIKVAYDDDSSWPFVWYLRNYKNAQFYGKSPGAPFDAEVVIVGSANESAVKPFLGTKYIRRQMRLIWWPDETYKDLTWTRLFGGKDQDGNTVQSILSGDNLRSLVRDVWFYHKYPTSLSSWPYVHQFSMYVRRDIANSLWQYAGVVPPPPVSTEQDLYTTNYIPNVQARTAFGSAGVGNGQFTNPHNVALGPVGDVYVADSNNHLVQKFDAQGKFLVQWGGQGNGPGQFNEPWGIAVDKEGNVFVADTWNHRIEKFDSNGKFLLQWGTFGDGVKEPLTPAEFYGPRAIAVDPDGNLWVTDTGNKRVLKFDPNGQSLGVFGGAGADPGQFLEPVGIASDGKGDIFVADTWNQRIQKFDKGFNPIQQWTVQAWDGQSVVNKPYLATDANGNVYASDPEGYRIIKFSSDGKVLAVWGTRGNTLSSFELPTGLAIGSDGGIYVADSGNNRILIFAPIKQ